MKIINTSAYEKLKIRPVDIKNMSSQISEVTFVNPKDIGLEEMRPGYFIKTNETKNSLYMTINSETMRKCMGHDRIVPRYLDIIFVQPDRSIMLATLQIASYKSTWPEHCFNTDFDVKAVFKTNADTSVINTQSDFVNLFDKYTTIIRDYENI